MTAEAVRDTPATGERGTAGPATLPGTPAPAAALGHAERPLRIAMLTYKGNPFCGGQGVYVRHLSRELARLGFTVTPSQANFVWARRQDRPVKPIFEELKRRGILVRYMVYDGYGDGLRVSVGTDEEIDRLLAELKSIL